MCQVCGAAGVRTTQIVIHGFVLRFQGKDVLWALRSHLAIVRVDVRRQVRNAVFAVADCFRVAVKVVYAIRLPLEVSLVFEGVEAVEGDGDFDAVASRVEHEVVKAVENFDIPGLGGAAFGNDVAVYLGAFSGRGLAWNWSQRLTSRAGAMSMMSCDVKKDSPSSQTRGTCILASFRPVNRVVCCN